MAKSSFTAKLLFKLSSMLRCRLIDGNDGKPYLERYHLFRLPAGGGVYIHRFLASDPGRGLHDHPWKHALGVVLSGGYKELRLTNQQITERFLGPLSLNRIRGDDFHRVVLPCNNEAWTLFAHTGKRKSWGFLEQDENGEFNFSDHETVTDESTHKEWWKSAPRGRTVRRVPLHQD